MRGGKNPRQTHVKAGSDRTRYDVSKNRFDLTVGHHVFPEDRSIAAVSVSQFWRDFPEDAMPTKL
jgi:hypothetical protein